jgi:hypothetical protein
MVLLKGREIKETHFKKLTELRNKQHPSDESVKSILSPITNVSKRTLTDKEINILENGLNFVLPDNTFDEMAFISNIETFFVELLGHCTDKKDYDEKEADEEITYNLTPIQLQSANKIRSVCNNFRSDADKIINKNKHETIQFKKVLKNLSNDKSIQITRPDKGKGVVIMDKEEYNNKMLEILNDRSTFEVVKVDETIAQEDRLIRKLKQLKDDGFITEKEYNFCRPRGSQPARIYGLPKTHKTGMPLRPIVSASGTFNYNLAKLLANKLDHLRKNNTIIKDTFTFVDELLSLKFNNSQIKMISFDITSLFTNVPLNRTIQIILDKFYGREHTCTYSDKKRVDWCTKCKNRYEMKYLLETSTKETKFIFNDTIYSQTNGVAMGSPLGPLFADIYVNYLEEKLMSRLKSNGLLYWRRFVDDTFAIVKKDANVDKIIDILNSFDNSIVFTFEEEVNHSLPFLDIYITRLPTNNLTNDVTNTNKDNSNDNNTFKNNSTDNNTLKNNSTNNNTFKNNSTNNNACRDNSININTRQDNFTNNNTYKNNSINNTNNKSTENLNNNKTSKNLTNRLYNELINYISNSFSSTRSTNSNNKLFNNPATIRNNISSVNINNNSKINSFINSIIKSKEKSLLNSANNLNNNSLSNHLNFFDNESVTTPSNISNIKSTDKLNKKSFTKLTKNSDLISSSISNKSSIVESSINVNTITNNNMLSNEQTFNSNIKSTDIPNRDSNNSVSKLSISNSINIVSNLSINNSINIVSNVPTNNSLNTSSNNNSTITLDKINSNNIIDKELISNTSIESSNFLTNNLNNILHISSLNNSLNLSCDNTVITVDKNTLNNTIDNELTLNSDIKPLNISNINSVDNISINLLNNSIICSKNNPTFNVHSIISNNILDDKPNNNLITKSSTIPSNSSNNNPLISPINNSINLFNNNRRVTFNLNNLNNISDDKLSTDTNTNSLNMSSNNLKCFPINTSVNNSIIHSTNNPDTPYDISTLKYTKSFITTIYRKPTYTGLITKWNSYTPHSYKVSTISSMIYRAIRICSSYDLIHEEFEFIEFICRLNGYPEYFIKSQIRKTFNRYINKINGIQSYKSKNKEINNQDNLIKKGRIFLDIPFFGKPTEVFKKRIIKLTKSINPQLNIQPIQRPPATLSKYFPMKDQIPKLLKSKVVYKLDCSNCEATYIGKTMRHVRRRLHEHGAVFDNKKEVNSQSIDIIHNSVDLRRSERNKGKIIHYFPETYVEETSSEQTQVILSAVKQHENSNNHRIDWTNCNIIARDNKNYQLLVKESLLINELKPTLNRTTCSVPLIIYPEGLRPNRPKVKIKSTLDALSHVETSMV